MQEYKGPLSLHVMVDVIDVVDVVVAEHLGHDINGDGEDDGAVVLRRDTVECL